MLAVFYYASFKMWCVNIMKMMSKIQMIFHPKINLIKPNTQCPSANLVTNPKTQEVAGMMAKINETIQGRPK